MDLSHLTNHEEQASEDTMEKIVNLVRQYEEKKDALAMAEHNAKQAKKEFNNVSMHMIPDALGQAGLNSIELSNGKKVSYKTEASASVQNMSKFSEFLEEHGDDSLMKCTLEIGKVPTNILQAVLRDLSDKYGIEAEVKQSIHHMTLKSYVEELLGIKKNSSAKMTIGDIDDKMLKVYTFNKTIVK